MEVSRISSLNWIKSNAEQLVKPLLLGVVVFVSFSFTSSQVLSAENKNSFPEFETRPEAANEPPPPQPAKKPIPDNDDDTRSHSGELPPIEARTYDLKVVRRSNSNKVYLFEDLALKEPQVGRILLLKKDDENIMAFRVLKAYPQDKMVAAKRVRRYRKHRFLENGDQFLTIEKVSDVAPPPNSPEDNLDLAELEKKEEIKEEPAPPAIDSDLDQAVIPEPSDENKNNSPAVDLEDIDQDPDSHLALTVEEPQMFDHSIHWLTAGFGFVRNNGPPSDGGSYNFSAGNIRYGVSVARLVFLGQPHLQDSIVLEGGMYLYKAISFADKNDAYTIASFVGTIRYNILFSESFGIFFYAGAMGSRVLSSVSGQDSVVSSLSSTLPAGGAGLLFQVGPSWYIRADLGLDSMGLNLLLRL
jgi:hypothetical protein